jgi:hypothetical protein
VRPPHHFIAHVAATAAIAAACGAPVAHAASERSSQEAAALPGGFGVRPVVPKGKRLPPSYFVIDAGPGSIARRSVVIVNGTRHTKTLIVDGVDGLTGQTTGVVYANRDQRHREASRWVRPSQRIVRVAAGTTQRMPFTIRVPQQVRPGDHVAGLAFEDQHVASSKSRFSVKQIVRVVVGIQLHIDGGAPAQATVGALSMQAQPGTQVATTLVQLSNVGDTLCKPTLAVTLQPEHGQPRTVTKALDTVLPRDTIAYPMPFDGRVDGGRYRAVARTTGCGTPRTRAAEVRLGASLDGSSPRARRDAAHPRDQRSGWWSTAALIVVGITGGVGGLLLVQRLGRRRQRRSDDPKPS